MMRVVFYLLGLAGLLTAAVVLAAGGTSSAPEVVRMFQGNRRDFFEVDCSSSSDKALVSAAQGTNAMSLYFFNTAASGGTEVTICPRAAATHACDGITKGLSLPPHTGFTSNVSVADGPWSCFSGGASAIVEVYIEREANPTFIPTPTAIP